MVALPASIECVVDAHKVLAHFGVPYVWLQEVTGVADTYAVYLDTKAEWTQEKAEAYHAARAYFDKTPGKRVAFAQNQ